MKKSVMLSYLVVACALATGFHAYTSQNESEMSDLVIANIEALANNEGAGEKIKCYTSLAYELGSAVVECASCQLVENKTDRWYSFSDECTRDT